MNLSLSRVESSKVFDEREDVEDKEAMEIPCPMVESCGAEIGERCCTQSGQPRVRHARRLMEARKRNGN